MQERLVSKKIAELAKEKGFDVNCRNGYNTLGELHSFTEHAYMKRFNSNSKLHLIDTDSEEFEYPKFSCTAPRQSLLMKWLRDIHGIYVDSYHDISADGTYTQYYTSWGLIDRNDPSGWYDEYNDWRTYEDALEYGLEEGLNLIKE